MYRNIGEAIQGICTHVSKDHPDIHDWLFAVPLVHFLTQVCAPFDCSVLLMEEPKGKDETWWGADGFETKVVRERSFMGNRYFDLFSYQRVLFLTTCGRATIVDISGYGRWHKIKFQ